MKLLLTTPPTVALYDVNLPTMITAYCWHHMDSVVWLCSNIQRAGIQLHMLPGLSQLQKNIVISPFILYPGRFLETQEWMIVASQAWQTSTVLLKSQVFAQSKQSFPQTWIINHQNNSVLDHLITHVADITSLWRTYPFFHHKSVTVTFLLWPIVE